GVGHRDRAGLAWLNLSEQGEARCPISVGAFFVVCPSITVVAITQRGTHDLVIGRMKFNMIDSAAPAIMRVELLGLSIDDLCVPVDGFGADVCSYLTEHVGVSLRRESRNGFHQCLVGGVFVDVNAWGWLVCHSVCDLDKRAHGRPPMWCGRPIILRHNICNVEMNSWTGRCVCSTVAWCNRGSKFSDSAPVTPVATITVFCCSSCSLAIA